MTAVGEAPYSVSSMCAGGLSSCQIALRQVYRMPVANHHCPPSQSGYLRTTTGKHYWISLGRHHLTAAVAQACRPSATTTTAAEKLEPAQLLKDIVLLEHAQRRRGPRLKSCWQRWLRTTHSPCSWPWKAKWPWNGSATTWPQSSLQPTVRWSPRDKITSLTTSGIR